MNKNCENRKTEKTPRPLWLLPLLVSAVLFALPFNVEAAFPLAWFCLSVLFLAIFDSRMTKKRVLCSLFCFFFAFYFCAYIWFANLYPLDFAGLSYAQSVAVVAAALLLIPLIHTLIMTLPLFATSVSCRNIKSDMLKAILISAAYTSGELLQSMGTFAFPWTRLFVTQVKCLPMLQSASLFGSYFITFVMVLVNALFALSAKNMRTDRKKAVSLVVAVVVLVLSNFAFGCVRMAVSDENSTKKIGAVVLQGNIPSGQKWDGSVSNTDVYVALADEADKYLKEQGLDANLVLLPETAIPYTLDSDERRLAAYSKNVSRKLRRTAEKMGADLLVGAFSDIDGNSANSVFVYGRDGSISQPCSKYNLVPFGEFLPYRKIVETLMPPLAEINMLSSDLVRGNRSEVLETEVGKVSSLICFDSIFPENARTQVKNGAVIITVSTNDSWYKQSRALYQHAHHAVMRGIENGRAVIRSANTGISLISDRFGRVKTKTAVDERAFVFAEVYTDTKLTLYTKIGDVIAYVSLLSTILCAVFAIIKNTLRKQRV